MKRIALIASAVLISTIAIAPASQAATERSVSVNAEGTVKVVPDAARLSATITYVGASNSLALSGVASGASAFRKTLTTNGVPAKDLASQSVSAYPEYTYAADGTSQITGYRASQSFAVTIRKAANAGTIVDAVAEAVGGKLQINGVSPFLLDPSKSSSTARSAAIKNARAKALSYAKLLGLRLGKVISVVENSSPSATPVYAAAKDASESTVIDLGEQDVTVSITVKWSLI
jgi:uncharacterized protein YggE